MMLAGFASGLLSRLERARNNSAQAGLIDRRHLLRLASQDRANVAPCLHTRAWFRDRVLSQHAPRMPWRLLDNPRSRPHFNYPAILSINEPGDRWFLVG